MIEGVGEIDALDLLHEIGMENIDEIGRGEIQFSCPFTDGHAFGDSNPSNHMNKDKLVYRCKGCGATGTAFSLIGQVLRLNPVETLRWLRDRYGDGYQQPRGGSVMAEMREREEKRAARHQVKRRILPSESETIGPQGIFTLDWNSDHEAAQYMGSRGFNPALLDLLGFGFDTWTNRVAIPIRDADGQLVGFKGRAIIDGANRKYDLLGDDPERKLRYGVGYGFTIYDPREVIFGLDRVQGDRLVVCEGELNAVALRQAGVSNAVAIGTTTITLEQQRLLRWHAKEIVLFYDSDPAGFSSTWGHEHDDKWYPGVVDKLSPYLRVRVVPAHEGDPASLPPEECVELVERAQSWMAIAVE